MDKFLRSFKNPLMYKRCCKPNTKARDKDCNQRKMLPEADKRDEKEKNAG